MLHVRFRNLGSLASLLILASFSMPASADDELSKGDKKWMEEEVGALITEKEIEIFKEIESKDRKLFKEIFWARRDPNTMTPDNEFEDEFERRQDVADSEFRGQRGKGSTTDMGKVFILLGAPDESRGRETPGAPGGPGSGGGGGPETMVWTYEPNPDLGIPEGLTLQFRTQPGFGYRLIRTDDVEETLDRVKSRYTNPTITYNLNDDGRLMKPPARLDPNSPAKKALQDLMETKTENPAIPIEPTPKFFRAAAGDVYIPVLLEIDPSKLTWKGDKAPVIVFGMSESADGRQSLPTEVEAELTKPENGSPAVYDLPFQVAPGNHTLYLGVINQESDAVGTTIVPIEAPDFSKDELTTSSVIVFDESARSEEPSGTPGHSFQFGEIQFFPRTDEPFTYMPSDTFQLFFFVYGFSFNESGDPNVTEQYIFSKDGQRTGQTANQPLQVHQDQGVCSPGIPLQTFEPGDYKVEIKITDHVSNTVVTEAVDFVIEGE